MCGIVGFIDKREVYSSEEKRNIAGRMLHSLKHRGPDGEGVIVHKNLVLAQARLSIVDLSSAGTQPMWNAARSVALAVNGEIYNHPYLRAQLEKKYGYFSHSDSESLLHAYEEWGDDCLERCKGMYALSILDAAQDSLFLAVDRFSIKPLYYVDTADWFGWSSEVKALFQLPGVTAKLNKDALGEYLMFRSNAGEETLFARIYKMTPAQSLRYDAKTGAITKKRYWNPREAEASSIEDVEALLKQSVHEHMLSDVPIGVQLSGGLDSSLISAIVRDEVDGDELHSFSIGYSDPAWNEFPFSREVSAMLKTHHHELMFTEEEFCAALSIATYHYDEPINHSHSIPMMLLSQEAKKVVTVLMSGEGADELFGGYKRYPALLSEPLSNEKLLYSNAYASRETMSALLRSGDVHLQARESFIQEISNWRDDQRLALYDLQTYLPTLLLRQDKMGMRWAIENRVPFLDHELVECALHVPADMKIKGSETKLILKKIAEKFLSGRVIQRQKVGFGQPIAAWLRNEKGLGRFLKLFQGDAVRAEIFDYLYIQRLIAEHIMGKDHSHILWTLICFEIWARMFIDGVSSADLIDS